MKEIFISSVKFSLFILIILILIFIYIDFKINNIYLRTELEMLQEKYNLLVLEKNEQLDHCITLIDSLISNQKINSNEMNYFIHRNLLKSYYRAKQLQELEIE